MTLDRKPAPYVAAGVGAAGGGSLLAWIGWLVSSRLGHLPLDVDLESAETVTEALSMLADLLVVVGFVGGGAVLGAGIGASLGTWLTGGDRPLLTGVFTCVGLVAVVGAVSLPGLPAMRLLVILALFLASVCGVLAHWVAAELLANDPAEPPPSPGG